MMMLFAFSVLLLELTDQKESSREKAERQQAKQLTRKESVLLTFGLLVPFGIFGAIGCVLYFLVVLLVQVLFFLFLLVSGFTALTYGYLERNLGHLFQPHKPIDHA